MLKRSPAILPHVAPADPYARLLLYGIRRMAAGGLGDAHAAQAFLAGFGMGFTRPLMMLRAFMAEAARVAAASLIVAPCCCGRMTEAERTLLGAFAAAEDDAAGCHAALAGLLHVRHCLGLVTSAQAVAASFADQGMRLSVVR